MLYRTRFIIGGLTAFLLFLALFLSCNIEVDNNKLFVSNNKVERHKLLTFFFDGVPSLESEKAEELPVDPNSPQLRKSSEVVWYIHEPAKEKKDCARCHGNQQQRNFSREVQLTARPPELCYECHESLKPTALKGRVHGPVAVGECLFCHDPHKTQHQYLLKKPIPELCFGCHKKAVIELIDDHSKESYSKCNYCHEGHVSSVKYLLKPGRKDNTAEVKEPESDTGPSAQ